MVKLSSSTWCIVFTATLALAFPSVLWGQASESKAMTPSQKAPIDCSALNHLKLSSVSSMTAEQVTTGKIQPAVGAEITGLPPFCRVRITASPAKGSNINIEIWIPQEGWNGRFLGTGNGGGGGKIYYPPLRAGLKRGFITANTDLGTSPNANQVANSPEAWVDFGYRATHVMTVLSKVVIKAMFGVQAKYSYFWGNSTGGQQAMSEAERYPEDYNGIIAGGAAINRTHLHSYFVWNYQATHTVEGKSALSPETIGELDKAIVASCAGKDGGAPTDDFLTDPRVCKFDPASMPLCDSNHGTKCLSAPQLAALKAIYAGPTNPKTGERIYAPMPFGSESYKLGIVFQENKATANTVMYPFFWAFGADFNPLAFNFDKGETALDEKLAGILNANNPDLSVFQKKGGKLIMFTGTADPIVPFPDEVNYYERVVDFEKKHPQPGLPSDPLLATQTFLRYYIVPGMGHGGEGPGLNNFGQLIEPKDDDLLHALELWVEQNSAPDEILAIGWNDATPSKGVRLRRNICPYPELPTYVSGNASKESSFKCEVHPRGGVAVPASRYLR